MLSVNVAMRIKCASGKFRELSPVMTPMCTSLQLKKGKDLLEPREELCYVWQWDLGNEEWACQKARKDRNKNGLMDVWGETEWQADICWTEKERMCMEAISDVLKRNRMKWYGIKAYFDYEGLNSCSLELRPILTGSENPFWWRKNINLWEDLDGNSEKWHEQNGTSQMHR